jgi:type IX secretion system PorP/SprF family membrane protein
MKKSQWISKITIRNHSNVFYVTLRYLSSIFLWHVLVFTSLPYLCHGQQDPLFSHYMLNRPVFNAAYHGYGDQSYITAIHRTQWLGYSTSFDGTGGAPTSQVINFSAPMSGKLAGIGINIINDQLGPMNRVKIQPAVSASHRLKKGTISFGIAPVANVVTLNFNELRFVDPSDPLNIGTKETQFSFDLEIGVAYITESWDFGLSMQNGLEPSYNFGIQDFGNNQQRSFLGMGTYHYREIYNFVISPSFMVRSDLTSTTFDASVLTKYKEQLWVGLSYRYSEAIIVLLGYSFLNENKMSVGYSFDYVLRNQEAKRPTSHEVFLRYNLPTFGVGGKKTIRTPRFIF